MQDALNRQSENFGKQIADVAERAGEYKADLRTIRNELKIAHQKLLQLNPGPVEMEAEEPEEPTSVLHPAPAPAVVSVHSPETSATIGVRVINHDAPTQTPAVPEEEEMAGDAPLHE